MRRVLPFKLMLAVLLAACVTVNVYFPAAAAQQAADQIIDTVTSQPGSAAPQNNSGNKPQSSLGEPRRGFNREETPNVLLLAAGRLLELLIPAAHAQADANLDINSTEIRAVTQSMQARFAQLEKYFTSGVLGLTSDGLVAERDASSVPLTERATVKRLVAEDNRDRATLYTEIAKANGHPEWEADIRQIFARRWVERGAKPGWYYQDSGGAWKQK
jgi:uncharacterized protein YdbL (DUF1318 family)